MEVRHFVHGFIKTFVFAFVVAMVSSYKGVTTRGGAEGVGKSTTSAVVLMTLSVLIVDALFPPLLLN